MTRDQQIQAIGAVKELLSTGSAESRELLSEIIPHFDDVNRLPSLIADDIEPLVAELPDGARAQWTITVGWLRGM